ncbi:glycosyltransferase family 2 protein [Candidatus Pelagibacter sp.]|nr:glycosyltransferase family 2 protein [Candidatus Pelagibacter sp.]
MTDISIVTPIYNEEKNISPFLERIVPVLEKMKVSYEIIFVLDVSEDDTEKVVLDHIKDNTNIKLIVMSRRFGQPAAMLAGLNNSLGEKLVFIDVDLQDPPELISKMYDEINNGYDVVLAKRKRKINENFIRKSISALGYILINKLSDTNIPKNIGEYRMISKKIIDKIRDLRENEFFLRGIVSYIGFKQKIIEFEREGRQIGETKYNKFTGSLRIGLNGIFSFSTKPLHLITIVSSVSFFFSSLIFILYLTLTLLKIFVFKYQFFIITLILLVASLIFFSLGIISEYLARLIVDIKKRPSYIIDKKYNIN